MSRAIVEYEPMVAIAWTDVERAVTAERERCADLVESAAFAGDQEEKRAEEIAELAYRIRTGKA